MPPRPSPIVPPPRTAAAAAASVAGVAGVVAVVAAVVAAARGEERATWIVAQGAVNTIVLVSAVVDERVGDIRPGARGENLQPTRLPPLRAIIIVVIIVIVIIVIIIVIIVIGVFVVFVIFIVVVMVMM